MEHFTFYHQRPFITSGLLSPAAFYHQWPLVI